MQRVTAPSFIVALVNDLISFYEVEESANCLGYPSKSVEARVLESPGVGTSVARSRVPMRQLPPRLWPVERAINMMPDDMRLALVCRHLKDYPRFASETGMQKSTFYALCDQAYWLITGVVNAELDKGRER